MHIEDLGLHSTSLALLSLQYTFLVFLEQRMATYTININREMGSQIDDQGPEKTGCCIYNTPKKLKQLNEEAYTPQAVSIGPLHRKKPHLQAMQLKKNEYSKQFCNRTRRDMNYYQEIAKKWEKGVRDCYEGDISMNSDEFVDMILVDGMFVVEVLLKICQQPGSSATNEDDEIFKNNLYKNDVIHDLMLVENQLPLFVLKKLFMSLEKNTEWFEILFNFARTYFRKQEVEYKWVLQALKDGSHLIDFYHILCVCANPSVKLEGTVVVKVHRPDLEGQKFELARRAKDLHMAGLQFIPMDSMLPFDLDFNKDKGELSIPIVTVNRWTEAFFTNLIAYEHCLREAKIITSFVVLMASLVEKPNDAKLLMEWKVIENKTMGDENDVCALFRNLYKKSMMDKTEFYYDGLCKDLNAYRKNGWHQWKADCYKWREEIKDKYFNSPWAIIALIAAAIGLGLSIVQTVYTIIKK